jgi:hypothetical protein
MVTGRRQGRLFPVRDGPVRRMRREADNTIRALRDTGRLEPCDQLLVALIRTAADAADELRDDPDARYHFNATLKLLAELDARLRTLGGPDHDAFTDLLAAASGTATPGDGAD